MPYMPAAHSASQTPSGHGLCGHDYVQPFATVTGQRLQQRTGTLYAPVYEVIQPDPGVLRAFQFRESSGNVGNVILVRLSDGRELAGAVRIYAF